MRKFKVNVNGTNYEVAVEELTGAAPVAAPAAPAAPVAAPVAAAPAPAPASAPAGGEQVTSPMPGTILGVNVTLGQTVNSGEVLMILEAMKMENEIMAPCSGKITALPAAKGSAVNTGDLLAVIG